MAAEYCSTPARALTLVSPPAGAREPRPRCGPHAVAEPGRRSALTERQRALLASLPRLDGPGPARAAAPGGARAGADRPARGSPRARAHARSAHGGPTPPPLTAEQQAALGAILAAAPGEQLLLHGVTGSGKTEVYLRAVGEALASGEGAIVLVPEIGLTPQIVSRFVDRFGDTVAVLHSRLSAGERHDEWARLRAGEARVCVGPRSAVFAPIDRLGLVVVDEEHDSSYKHEGDPRYDARAVAAQRARLAGAVLVAGSATPRPESFHAMRAAAAGRARRRRAAARGRDGRHARGAPGAAPGHGRTRCTTPRRASCCSTAAAGRTS